MNAERLRAGAISAAATFPLRSRTPVTPGIWKTPSLRFRGTVGEVLRSGGGKLSLTGGDPGEMRCEKPHSASCVD
jgi:hypothetical protein